MADWSLKNNKRLRIFIIIFVISCIVTLISYVTGDILTKNIPHQDYSQASQTQVAQLVDKYWDQPYGLYLYDDVSPLNNKEVAYSKAELKKVPAQAEVYWIQSAGKHFDYTKETFAKLLSDVQYDHANDGYLFNNYPVIPILKIIGTIVTSLTGLMVFVMGIMFLQQLTNRHKKAAEQNSSAVLPEKDENQMENNQERQEKLAMVDLNQPNFQTARRGYKKSEVDELLQLLPTLSAAEIAQKTFSMQMRGYKVNDVDLYLDKAVQEKEQNSSLGK